MLAHGIIPFRVASSQVLVHHDLVLESMVEIAPREGVQARMP
jgi:hypothetical protein